MILLLFFCQKSFQMYHLLSDWPTFFILSYLIVPWWSFVSRVKWFCNDIVLMWLTAAYSVDLNTMTVAIRALSHANKITIQNTHSVSLHARWQKKLLQSGVLDKKRTWENEYCLSFGEHSSNQMWFFVVTQAGTVRYLLLVHILTMSIYDCEKVEYHRFPKKSKYLQNGNFTGEDKNFLYF